MTQSSARHPRLMYRLLFSLLWSLGVVLHLQAQAPIAYYPFNGNASDESGNGHHGSVTGARLTGDRFGRVQSAYLFDGDDFIEVPHSDELVFSASESFTINAWVYICGNNPDFAGIVVKGPTNTLYPGYQFVIRGQNKAASVISDAYGEWAEITAPTAIADGFWHMVTLVVSPPASSLRIYVDGDLDAVVSAGSMQPDFFEQQRSLYIGKERNSDVYFTGGIDDVRIYNRILSETEILNLYRENGWTGGTGLSTVTNITACPNTTVVLTAHGLLPPYQWNTGATSQSITVPASGKYWVTGSVEVDCPRTDTFNIVAGNTLNVDAGNTKRICRGSSVLLIGTVGDPAGDYTYQWTPSEGLGSSTSAQTTASPRQTTRYYLMVTDSRGCTGIDSVTVVVDILPEGRAGEDLVICAGEEVQIGRSPEPGENYTYRWITGQGFSATDIPRPRVRPAATGIYVIEIRNAIGCTILDTVLVQVNSAPLLEAGPDVRFCAGAAVRIGSNTPIGNGPYQYLWTPATGLSSTSEAMPLASPTESTSYIVTVTDANGCSVMDTVMVVIDAMPSGGAGSDMMICPGEEVEIGTTPAAGEAYSYEWISGEGLSSDDIARPRVRPSASSEYVVRIRNAAGCELLDTVVVQVSAPRVDVVSDISICSGDIVRIGAEATGGSGPYQYSWTPATGLGSTTEAMPVAGPSEPTLYTVIVTDARGCRDTASVLVAPAIPRLAVASLLEGDELIFDPEIVANSYGAICDSVTLRNVSDLPLQLDAIALARNYYFSIPPSQLPFVIPAGSERRLAICYLPHTSFDQFDTLLLAVDCGIALPIALRTNALYADDCNTPIKFRMAEKPVHFKAAAPYPNPAGGSATLRVERAAPSLQPVPQEQCRLYSSDGLEVASAAYAPESAWSRDGVSYERGVFSFATDHLPSGIYYVRIQSEGKIISHPLVITR